MKGSVSAEQEGHPPTPEDMAEATQRPGRNTVPVVGVGASAGGIEAFQQLLKHLPVDTGMAFVFLEHLPPGHASILPEILSRGTKMPVHEIKDGMAVAPDNIYVIPPNTNLVISGGVLHLVPRDPAEVRHMSIDIFLASLAADRKDRAIGVILSGTASDGTRGLKAIKAEKGITFAQDEKTAKYSGMPRSAIATGCVDFILPPEDIAGELARLGRHAYLAPASTTGADEFLVVSDDEISQILTLVQSVTGDDFTYYRKNTINKCIQRRMVLHNIPNLKQYVRLLQGNPTEVHELYQDFVLSVTGFFRGPGLYQALSTEVLPLLLRNRRTDPMLRIWVAGCSTGEEAYSFAICTAECLAVAKSDIPVQIFGSDISEKAIEKARTGIYPENIAADVSRERLRSFFTRVPEGYRINRSIRQLCMFARHHVLQDPPFSRLDLIICRNLLVHFEAAVQRKLIPVFGYALRTPGFLILGPSEKLAGFSDLFSAFNEQHNIYSKLPSSVVRVGRYWTPPITVDENKRAKAAGEAAPAFDLAERVNSVLLKKYASAAVVITSDFKIVQAYGQAGDFLKSPSQPHPQPVKLGAEILPTGVRRVVNEARQQDAPVVRKGVRIKSGSRWRTVALEVEPLRDSSARTTYFLVLFREQTGAAAKKFARHETGGHDLQFKDDETSRMSNELHDLRATLGSLREEREAIDAELRAANERLDVTNEELQSTSEEMATSQEELQTSNEELRSVNGELQNRNLELDTLNSDLSNLVNSIRVPVVILSKDLRVRRYTPSAEKLLNLIPTDIGRPITDLKPNIDLPNWEKLVREAIDTMSVREMEVQDRNGRWYSLRVRPYKTLENVVEGAVVLLLESLEEERRRIARELHDGTGQILTALSLNLSALAPQLSTLDEDGRAIVSDCLNLARLASRELRNASHLLHPPALDEMGLEGALRWLVDNFITRDTLHVELIIPRSLRHLPDPIRLTAFRLVQEALSNCQRHSGAKTVKVLASAEHDSLLIEVVDDGCGIAPGHPLGLGLLGMRERVSQLGGHLIIDSDGRGTSIRAVLPLSTAV